MRNRIICLAIITLYLVLATYYSFANPPFEAPDEVWHYAYVREIVLGHGFPILSTGSPQPWGQEGAQAPLYYLLGAPLISWMDQSSLALPTPNAFARIGEPQAATADNRNAFLHSSDETSPLQGAPLALHVLRLYSVVLGAITVTFTFALAREVWPELPIAAPAAAAFVAFLPQFLFISSSVNNDNLATMLSSAALLLMARMLRRGISPARSAVLGATAGAALLTKFNTVTIIPLAIAVILLLVARERAWRCAFLNMGLVVVLVVLMAGWWYVRNTLLYGDLSGLSLIIQMIGNRSAPIDPIRWFLAENEGLRLSSWGVFGWMNVLAAPAYYYFFDLIAVAGLMGMIVAVARSRAWSWHVVLLVLWCVLVFAGVVYYNMQLPASQGRLLFPALAAWAILWARGIAALIPKSARTLAIVAVGAAQLLVAALTPALYIAPAYAPAQVTALPADTAQLDTHLSNGAEILGARVDRTAIQPGESFDVTVFTSVSKPEMAHAAVFVHVTNGDDVIVAQRDSAIASGNWSGLSYPSIVADSLRVDIPITAPAPDEWRVDIGTYDLDTRVRWTEVGTARDSFAVATLAAKPAAAGWGFDFGGKTTLSGAEISPRSGSPGNTMQVALHWQAAPPGYRVFVHALGEAEHIWASADQPLAREMNLILRFSADTPPGVYRLEMGLYPIEGDRISVFDGHGQLIADRLFLGPVRIKP